MIRRILDFVTNMDARAWRMVAVSFVLFGGGGRRLPVRRATAGA